MPLLHSLINYILNKNYKTFMLMMLYTYQSYIFRVQDDVIFIEYKRKKRLIKIIFPITNHVSNSYRNIAFKYFLL